MSPDEMLARLVEKAPRQKKTLEAIFAVCREIQTSGSTDYSYTNISRLGQGRGVPKSQSIYNETGVNYQALIKCFAAQQGTRKRFRPRAGHAWADEIEDPRIRIQIGRAHV